MLWLLSLVTGPALGAGLEIEILYLEQIRPAPKVLSRLINVPDDSGIRGAELGLQDNNSAGRFLGHDYRINAHRVTPDQDIVSLARELLDQRSVLALLNTDRPTLLAIADLPEAADDLLFNVSITDIELRNRQCRANLLHTIPSRYMLTDALMQFLSKRKWQDLLLVTGNRPGDLAYAAALKHSADKFRLKIHAEKSWLEDADLRRSAASELPPLTQSRKYDVVLVADESDDFGPFVPYNTWLPRPVVGTAGLEAVAWSAVVEQWGALQLQTRFTELAARDMTPTDYAAWAAVRSVGEAVTRIGSSNVAALNRYLLSADFTLAGFKGAAMSYRHWNGQLRQPIPLVQPQAVVALAPLPGFLHQHTELDTLGLDAPESDCPAFRP